MKSALNLPENNEDIIALCIQQYKTSNNQACGTADLRISQFIKRIHKHLRLRSPLGGQYNTMIPSPSWILKQKVHIKIRATFLLTHVQQ